MKRVSYREPDHSFGQTMLTLRTSIGLTQAGLAGFVGVSRRAVGDWETGSKYPSAAHLKRFIALAVEHQVFPSGREPQEVRALWQAANQKVLLDEAWLNGLLLQLEASQALQPSEEASRTVDGVATPPAGPLVDWGDALAVPSFYGREWEMDLLTEWLVQERCRVVSVIGLGGIGKSALSVSLMHQVAERFEVVIWRSLRDLPTYEVLLNDLLRVLRPQMLGQLPASTEERQAILLEHLRSTRVLLVLDNVESVMEEGEGIGRMRPGYEGFGRFLRQTAGTEHQSCVLLTSREKPGDLLPYEGSHSPVRALRLARLDSDACEELLVERDVRGTAAERARLIDAYAGNPLALKIVAQTIVELFDGEIAPFLEQGEVVFGGIRDLLSEQFVRLSALEQSVLLWLAILREPSSLDELLAVLFMPVPRARLLEAVESLSRRSLIEHGQKPGSFTLQSVVLEYATAQLIAEAGEEIQNGKLARLIEHSLELAQSSEYVRQNQERLIVAPVLAHLWSVYRQQAGVEGTLLALLAQLATWAEDAQGYAPANLVTLIGLQRGHLREIDLSRLSLRGVYLQGVRMEDATLSGATIRDSLFTKNFDAVMGVAISGNGEYWAASSRSGEIYVWKAASAPWGLTLHRTWQAHTDLIWPLAFSPDGQMLASGSLDSTVKLWDIASGTLLWSGRHLSHTITGVAYAPDGSMLASSGNDATILWDLQNGEQAQVLPHPDLTIAVAWSPKGDLLASSDAKGTIRLWEVNGSGSAHCVQTFVGHTAPVPEIGFSPDGRVLASASWDGTVKLWDVSGGSPIDTLTGHTSLVHRVVWSPDGRVLASCGVEKAILLWDVEQGRYRAALSGHADIVTGLAFTPDSRTLFSSGDSTLRIWDIASGRCVSVLQGNAAALFDVDWSPDGRHLVSGGSDALVTIYSVNGGTPPRVLRGHHGMVFGVGWSPDGAWLASGSWDTTIRLWDPSTGECVQVIATPDNPGTFFSGVAWKPDGQQLAGAVYPSPKGVLVQDIAARLQRWMSPAPATPIHGVVWSPDGKQLAGGGDDGYIYLWTAADGTLWQRQMGHERGVTSVAWSPDGTRLASGSSGREGGELFVWNPQRGERLHSIAGHPGTVSAVSWGPDERLLVSGGSDGILRWWDVPRGWCLLACDAHMGTVQSLRRSPDGAKLASCGDDGTIMLWDLRTGKHLQTLRRDRPYERLNITGIRGLTDVQRQTLRALGAIDHEPVPKLRCSLARAP